MQFCAWGQNSDVRLLMYHLERNAESSAVCEAGTVIKGLDFSNTVQGNALFYDWGPGKRFEYLLSDPSFGIE